MPERFADAGALHPRVAVALQDSGTRYRVHRHADHDVPIRSPHDFACALGVCVDQIAKTLLVRDAGSEAAALIVAPAATRVDLRRAAAVLGCGRLELASAAVLARRLGQPPTGVSPLGARDLPVVLDGGLLAHSTILVGGGAAGVEVELSPRDLAAMTAARVIPSDRSPSDVR